MASVSAQPGDNDGGGSASGQRDHVSSARKGDAVEETESEEEEDEEEDEEDDEPKLKYARMTGNLAPVYRNGDATSTFLVTGDKMVGSTLLSRPSLTVLNTEIVCWNPQWKHRKVQ